MQKVKRCRRYYQGGAAGLRLWSLSGAPAAVAKCGRTSAREVAGARVAEPGPAARTVAPRFELADVAGGRPAAGKGCVDEIGDRLLVSGAVGAV